MKLVHTAPAAILVLSLAGSAAPAAAQHDPPFVARGAQIFAASDGNTLTCRASGAVGMWPDGRSVLAWNSANASGSYRTFSAEGTPGSIGSLGTSERLDIAAAGYGGFVSAFVRGSSGQTVDLQARIFDPQQAAQLAPAFPFASFDGSLPAVAAGNDGQFVLAWAVSTPAPAIVAARFDRSGNRVGSDIAVADVAGTAEAVDVTRAADGSFTVYWRQSAASGGSLLHLRRFGADGAPLDVAVPVGATDPQLPNAAGAADGDAVLVYTEGATDALFARRLAADGALGNAFAIFDQAASPVSRAQPAYLADGSIAAAAEIHFDGGAGSIHLFRFSRDGQQLGSRISVAIPTVPGNEYVIPRLAAAGDRLAVFYGRRTADGAACNIFVRLFDATLFADSFESGDTSAWNGGL